MHFGRLHLIARLQKRRETPGLHQQNVRQITRKAVGSSMPPGLPAARAELTALGNDHLMHAQKKIEHHGFARKPRQHPAKGHCCLLRLRHKQQVTVAPNFRILRNQLRVLLRRWHSGRHTAHHHLATVFRKCLPQKIIARVLRIEAAQITNAHGQLPASGMHCRSATVAHQTHVSKII